jgi:nucleoid-associated protein YgaU
MRSRYYNRNIFRVAHPRLAGLLGRRRATLQTPHYEGPFYITPSEFELEAIEQIQHTWKSGDRFFKIAHKYYGEPEAWWIIALYNGTPTEGHLKTGDVIYVPTPLSRVLTIYGF